MFTVRDSGTAVALCVLTMLGWGSWVNTLKAAGKRNWPLEFFYWDYVLGMMVTSLVVAGTFGSLGSLDPAASESLHQASSASWGAALLSGVLFNFANLLVVLATDLAGIAIAFPVAAGPALILSTVISYRQRPLGRLVPLTLGIVLILLAMVASAYASRKQHPRGSEKRQGSLAGVLMAILSAGTMGFFYPQLAQSMTPANSAGSGAGFMTPYAAVVVFSVGIVLSNLLINSILIVVRRRSYREYVRRPRVHLYGFAGGALWMVAITANMVACTVAGPAVSYALGQGATLVAAIWGVFVWKEFSGAPSRVKASLALMFASYAGGLLLVGIAAL